MDLILAPIILGVLTLMILNSTMLMNNSTAEVIATQQLQNSANNTVLVVKEEVRSLKKILSISNSAVSFVESDLDTVYLSRNDQNIDVLNFPFGGGASTSKSYFLRLDSLAFEIVGGGGLSPTFLRVTSRTKSNQNQQTNASVPFKAVAQQDIYLTNLHLSK